VGNVNTGGFDPVGEICDKARETGAWVHVDGAFGLVAFGDTDRTRRVIRAVQRDGTCWCGGTEWQGRTAMRISVSSWATTNEDVELSLVAILRAAEAEAGSGSFPCPLPSAASPPPATA